MADQQNPVLTGLTFSQPTLDPSSGFSTITAAVTASDGITGSGVLEIVIVLASPSGDTVQGTLRAASLPNSAPSNGGVIQGMITFKLNGEIGSWLVKELTVTDREDNSNEYSTAALGRLSFQTSFAIPSPSMPPASGDGLTGEKTVNLVPATNKATGTDGIIDRFRFETSGAPASPWIINGFNPTEDRLQIPQGLLAGTARATLYSVEKVIIPDRLLTKSEYKTLKKQQKAAAKAAKRIGRTGDGFAYNQQTGELFVDTNGSQKGFGKDGGLLAVLEGTPAININHFQLL